MDGFLIIDKEASMSCMDVCYKLKKNLKLAKCGHNGTLDPDATGVMIVAINKATKLIKLIEGYDKAYIAKIVFGYDSDTLDAFGNITNDIKMSFTKNELLKAIDEVIAMPTQIPPLTSAIKLDGHKLWWYQKNGIEVDVPKRKVKVLDYKLIGEPVLVDNHYEIDIYLHVEKGFYIRSFARDLGEALNGCAILKALRRTQNGSFSIEQAKKLNEATEENIISIEEMFKNINKLEVEEYIAHLVKNGVVLDERQIVTDKPFFVTYNNDIIALYEPVDVNRYKPILIF